VVWLIVGLELLGLWVTVDRSLTTTGEVIADTEVGLPATVEGRVLEVLVKDGQWVEKGEVLVRFDTSAIERRLENLDRQIAFHEEEVDRLRSELSSLQDKWAAKRRETEASFTPEEVAQKESERAAMERHWKTKLDEARANFRLAQLEKDRIEEELENKVKLEGLAFQSLEIKDLRHQLAIAKEQVRLRRLQYDRSKAERSLDLEKAQTALNDAKKQLEQRERSLAALEAEQALELQRLQTQIDKERRTRAELRSRRLTEEETLTLCEVTAPWDASVVAKPEVGVFVSKGGDLLELATTADLRFRTWVAEEHVADLRLDQPCLVKLDAFPYMRYGAFSGKVVEIGVQPEVREESDGEKELQVDVLLDDPRSPVNIRGQEGDFYLMPHLTGSVDITVERDVPFLVMLLRRLYE
jgi:multidrug resistance efflux pump